jgi:hypothetical protein
MVFLIVSAISLQGNAQGRGNGRGNGNANGHNKNREYHANNKSDRRHDSHDRHEHHDRRAHYSYDRHDHHDRQHHHAHAPVRRVYTHHHSHSCEHRVVVHHCDHPRYVYYRDYDVYYDNHRHVYITFSGRNWSISTGIPVHMRHVDVHHAGYAEVQYYDDDFVTYLDRGQPIYGRFYASR